MGQPSCTFFFFFNDTATTEIYTLSLHDALPIFAFSLRDRLAEGGARERVFDDGSTDRSEEHTSELQSQSNLVCRLLLEKKKYFHEVHLPGNTHAYLHRYSLFCNNYLLTALVVCD